MARTLDLLPAEVEAVRSVWRGPDAGSLSDGDLVAVHDRYCRMRRMLDADQALLAAEIARRSRPELGPDSLAKTHGYRNPTALIAATSGGSIGDAARLVKVGEATTPRQLLSGETAPARHPHVAAALSAATLTERAAAAIIALLDRVALPAGPAAIDTAEQTLVAQAPGLTMDQLSKILVRAEATLDPDGVARREDEARADTSLTIREDRGRIIMHAELDPARGAPVKAAIEAIVADEMRTTRDVHRNGTAGPLGPGVARGSVKQMQADALVRLCEHALGCSQTDLPLAGATVVVRINHEDLVNNTGFATIDGIDAPVSVSTARRMAAGGGIVSCVLGGDSQVLDWGRIKRLYTATQKLVLVERDGGCAMCGAPPGHTKVHHIKWWARDAGPTDLNNGLLLDDPCHHIIHDEGWEVYIEGIGVKAKVWFIPPPHIDPARTPRLGGRARYDYAA